MLRWNLIHKAGKNFTKKVPQNILFAYTRSDVWTRRHSKLFNGESNELMGDALESMFKVQQDMQLLNSSSLKLG